MAQLKRLTTYVTAILVVFGLFSSSTLAIGTIATGWRSIASDQTVNAHSVCYKVRSNDGREYFVPTKASTEWTNFVANHGPGVTLSACDLYGGVHDAADCASQGGVLYDTGSTLICRLSGSSCPGGGWTQFNYWSTTGSVSCHDSMHQHPEAWEPLYTDYQCDTGSHGFSNTSRETCQAYHYGRWCHYSGWDSHCHTHTNYTTCYANVTEMGCY